MLGDAELLSTSVDWVEARPRHGKGEGTIIRVTLPAAGSR